MSPRTRAYNDQMTSSFWTEEQERQYLEQQARDVERPVDLERYEATSQAQARMDQDEELQSGEPPYARLGNSMQLDSETRQLFSDGGEEQGEESRGRQQRSAVENPQLARIEARVDVSPGRRSMGFESIHSQRSSGEARGVKEADDLELMPDYAQLPVDNGGVAPAAAQEAAPLSIQAVMAQMGSVMNQLIQEQLGPTLNQMMLHQARVESRLEVLEATSRPMSVAGDAVLERAILDGTEVARPQLGVGAKKVDASLQEGVHSSSSEVQSREVANLTARLAQLNRESGDPQVEDNQEGAMGRSEVPQSVTGGKPPTQGEIVIGGVRHAWSIGTSGLQLQPLETKESLGSPSRGLRAGDVFAGRTPSPFERNREEYSPPKTEPKPGARVREAVARQLRPSNSDPGRSSNEVPEAPHGPPPSWMEQGRAELEALLNSSKPEAPKALPGPRSVTPVKPRIVYPYSPGGTEAHQKGALEPRLLLLGVRPQHLAIRTVTLRNPNLRFDNWQRCLVKSLRALRGRTIR